VKGFWRQLSPFLTLCLGLCVGLLPLWLACLLLSVSPPLPTDQKPAPQAETRPGNLGATATDQ